jgi:hypothetical protein
MGPQAAATADGCHATKMGPPWEVASSGPLVPLGEVEDASLFPKSDAED